MSTVTLNSLILLLHITLVLIGRIVGIKHFVLTDFSDKITGTGKVGYAVESSEYESVCSKLRSDPLICFHHLL